jgi:NADH:ubiquinone oxidoreductase subunit 5 (subunit L)/multisubunit Na+/H+ antiporter MnhA subunit
LLINFWYTHLQANKAAIQAIMVNKIGDIAVMLAISCVFLVYYSVDFALIFALTPYFTESTVFILSYQINVISFIGFLVFIGAVGKSAQLGLHT